MNHDYMDIISRIDEPPLWWDEYAVPRYCEFSPRVNANIYADEVVLLLIQCQGCGQHYKVCLSSDLMKRIRFLPDEETGKDYTMLPTLAESIQSGSIGYGDPPHTDCCAAGPTMSSVSVRVLEYWTKPKSGWEKERKPELEIDVWSEWMPRAES